MRESKRSKVLPKSELAREGKSQDWATFSFFLWGTSLIILYLKFLLERKGLWAH
jgi:hypothetical protein